MRKVVDRIGQQIQISGHLLVPRFVTRRITTGPVSRQEAPVRYVLDVARALPIATAANEPFGQFATTAPQQAGSDFDTLWLRVLFVHVCIAGEDLFHHREEQQTAQHPEAAAQGRMSVGRRSGRNLVLPRFRQQMQKDIAQQATHGEAEQQFEGL